MIFPDCPERMIGDGGSSVRTQVLRTQEEPSALLGWVLAGMHPATTAVPCGFDPRVHLFGRWIAGPSLAARRLRFIALLTAQRSADFHKSAAKNMKEIADEEGRSAARFCPEINVRLGQQLRMTYSDVMNQGVPDRHHELLQRIDARNQTDR